MWYEGDDGVRDAYRGVVQAADGMERPVRVAFDNGDVEVLRPLSDYDWAFATRPSAGASASASRGA